MLPVAILAGGLGTRLRPLTEVAPKAMLEIGGEPFVAHQLRLLRARGIERVVMCVGYLGEQIRDFVGDGARFGLAVDYSWDGPRLMGTAGALKRAIQTNDQLGEAFFVVYGDSYLPCDYRAAEEVFLGSGKSGLMTVFCNEGQWDASNVEFREGRIAAYDKRERTDRMRHIDYGLGAFRRGVFDGLADEPCDLASVYQDLLRRGDLAALEVKERFYEVGSVEGMNSLAELLA